MTGLDEKTVRRGATELSNPEKSLGSRIWREGGGRVSKTRAEQ